MSRYIVTQDAATWLRNYYAVEVDGEADDPAEDAESEFYEGHGEFLGFDVECNVEHVDTELVKVEQTDADPCMGHPVLEHDPEAAQVAALVEAAEALLIDAIDRGETRPLAGDEQPDYPCDEDGDFWYPDWFALSEALEPFAKEEAS